MSLERYYLGCPMWANKDWLGDFFAPGTPQKDFLREYAKVFNSVEGNTTFYAVPKDSTVQRWAEEAPAGFRFVFKFPRAISHERRLKDAVRQGLNFVEVMSPLAERLGPFWLQLPPSLGPGQHDRIIEFLAAMPKEHSYAVELRHPMFFSKSDPERRIDDALAELGVDRVVFDTRGLRKAEAKDESTRVAQRKKPDLPAAPKALGQNPFIRFGGHREDQYNQPLFEFWAEQLAGWIAGGLTPWFFIHSPGDFDAPRVARLFHEALAAKTPVGTMPDSPVEQRRNPGGQLSLL